MSEPAKGTHWSNLISMLGVGGKKPVETSPPSPAPEPVVEAAESSTEKEAVTFLPSGELQIDWGKPTAKKKAAEIKAPEAKISETKDPESKTLETRAAAPPKGKTPAKAAPASKPAASPKKKHWGSLAEQLGLAAPTEPATEEEPSWIEESEQNEASISGDDAADECVSHPGGAVCAPEECEVRSESCKLRGAPQEEAMDTRDTEFLEEAQDIPASDEDLDALADLINEGAPPADLVRRDARRDEEGEEEEEGERPRSAGREESEGGGRRRRRRRGRGRGRREEGASDRGPSREGAGRGEGVRNEAGGERYDGFEDRYEKLRPDSDEDLDRDLDSLASEEEGEELRAEPRREPRGDESRNGGDRDEERGGRRRRRRRRRRGSEESAETGRGPRRESESTDRVRSDDIEYRRKEEPSDFDDEGEGDEPVAVHRNLPTWEEALSGIIGGNMENRARSPQPQYGRRGGGRDRGDRGDRGGDRGRDFNRGGRDRGPRRDDRR